MSNGQDKNSTSKKLTHGQRKWLTRMNEAERELLPPHESNFGATDRLLRRLCDMGLATPYPHGGYEITEAGRVALESPPPTPEETTQKKPLTPLSGERHRFRDAITRLRSHVDALEDHVVQGLPTSAARQAVTSAAAQVSNHAAVIDALGDY